MKPVRVIYSMTIVGVATFVFGLLAIILVILRRPQPVAYRMARGWSWSLLASHRIRVRAENMDKVDWDKPMVLVSNHRSHYDIPCLIHQLPRPLSFITKQELRNIPIFGPSVAKLGMVFIDRRNREAARRSLEIAGEQVKKNDVVVTIFAEGTRSDDGHSLRSFKKGAFHLAKQADAVIQPVVLLGTQKVLPKHALHVRTAEVVIRFGEPIAPAGRELEDLMAATHARMTALIDEG